MAILTQGILGALSGKVGQVIGATWRGINYIRIYAVPTNPNTVKQQAQRSAFGTTVAFAKAFLSPVINKFWEGAYPRMSGFNAFIRKNITWIDPSVGASGDEYMGLSIIEGFPSGSATYDALTGACVFTWGTTCEADGLATDKVLLAVYDNDNWYGFVNDTGIERSVGTGTVTLPAGLTKTDLYCYAMPYRGTAGNYITGLTRHIKNPS